MYSPEASPQPAAHDRHLVDLQYEEISNTRTAVLNRELVRMREQGWNVRLNGDHLVASRQEGGRSQIERTLMAVFACVVLAYAATVLLADAVASLPISKAEFLGASVFVGAAAAFMSRGQSSRERRVTVSIDGQGRPFVAEQGRDL